MDFITNPLNIVIFFPLVGVLVLLFLPSEKKNLLRWTALATTLVTFGLSIWMLTLFDKSNPDLQLGLTLPWIQVAGWNISYAVVICISTGIIAPGIPGVDAIANGLGNLTRRVSASLRRLQNGFVRSYALAVLFGVVVILGYLLLK